MSRTTVEFFLGYDEDGNYEVSTDRSDLSTDNVQVIAFEVELPSIPLPVVRVKLVQQAMPPQEPIRVEIPTISIGDPRP